MTKKYYFWIALILASFAGFLGLAGWSDNVFSIWQQTGLFQILNQSTPDNMALPLGIGQCLMIVVCLFLLYLGIARQFEPLLLIPIAIGGLLANMPGADMTSEGGLLYVLYHMGIANGLFPLLIFLGVGAMTDFGPMLANPKTALLGGAAQFAIFGTFSTFGINYRTYFKNITTEIFTDSICCATKIFQWGVNQTVCFFFLDLF